MASASADAFAAEALAFGTAVAREDEGKEEEAPGSPAEKVAKAAVAAKGPLVELDLSKLQELFVDIVGKVGEVGANQDKLANEIQTNKDELTELGVVVAGAARSQEHRALEDRVNELFDKLHALKTETELGLQGLVADFKAFKEAEENSKGRSGALERSLLDEALGTARNARDAAHSAHNHAENVRKTAEALTSRVDALEADASNYATKGDAAAALEAAHDARAHSERVLEATQFAGKQAAEALASATALRAEWDAAQTSMRTMLEAAAKRAKEAQAAMESAEAAARMFQSQSKGTKNDTLDLASRLNNLEEFCDGARETLVLHDTRVSTALTRAEEAGERAKSAEAETRDHHASALKRHSEIDRRMAANETARASLEASWAVFRDEMPSKVRDVVDERLTPAQLELQKLGARIAALAEVVDQLEQNKADRTNTVTPARLLEAVDEARAAAADARTQMRRELDGSLGTKVERLAMERAMTTLEEMVHGGDTAIAQRLRDLSTATDSSLRLKADTELVKELSERIEEIKLLFEKLKRDLSSDRMHWSNVGSGKATTVKVMESFHNQFGGIGSRELLDPQQAMLYGSASEYFGRRKAGGQLKARKKQQQTLYTWGAHQGQNPYEVHDRPITAPGGGTISGRAHSTEMAKGTRDYLTAVWMEADRSAGDLNALPTDGDAATPHDGAYPRRTGARVEQTGGRGGHHQNRVQAPSRGMTPEPVSSGGAGGGAAMLPTPGGLVSSASASAVHAGPLAASPATRFPRPSSRAE